MGPACIIERFRKKHKLIDIIFLDDHRSTGNLPVDRRPSPSLDSSEQIIEIA